MYALGRLALDEGDYAGARASLTSMLPIAEQFGDRHALIVTWSDLGQIAAIAGDREAARGYYAQSLTLARELGERVVIARALLGLGLLAAADGDEAAHPLLAEAAQHAHAVGERRLLDESESALAALARAPLPAAPPPLIQHPTSNIQYPDALTAREWEVLRLVADGLSNGEIAARLQLSVNTVQAHLRTIYGKIGVASRSAATRYVVEQEPSSPP
jgi:ATP/maltotriose-dependent transcriptional regulator MalT